MPPQQNTVVEQYTKLQRGKEPTHGPSEDVNSTLKMVYDKEQDQGTGITEGQSEEAIMLDQTQESQQDKEVSQSQTEANMRLIADDMEAQHAIAAGVDAKLQKATKATNNEDNEEELLIDLLTDVKIYKTQI